MKSDKNPTTKTSNTIYGLGFIGAVVYYLSTATSIWTGILGFVKALIWPAFLVYELLHHIGQ